jgi:hypothetical protein
MNLLQVSFMYNKDVLNYINNHNNINILFSFIDYIDINTFLSKNKSKIDKYYSLTSIINNENINIIDYYYNYKYVNYNYKYKNLNCIHCNKVKLINTNQYFTWNDFYNNNDTLFIFKGSIKEWNSVK